MATERVTCWRCGRPRPTFESCLACGGSCKPLTRRKQLAEDLRDGTQRAEQLASELVESFIERKPEVLADGE